MKKMLLLVAAVASQSAFPEVTVENARCRLTISDDGFARSLVVKSTGREMLDTKARVPFSTITQNRAYDNEFKLMYAAKPWTLPASAIERRGDELRIRYRDEFFTAVVKLEVTDSYIGFRLDRFDYELEASGFKRKTEIDAFALAQLPLKRRGHFGRTLNVVWDDDAFAALMAARLETRIDAFDRESGSIVLFAGTEKAVGVDGAHAVLAVSDGREDFLDCVDAMERDFDLPRGVRNRRHPLYAASYMTTSKVTAENIGEYIDIAREGGFRAIMTVGAAELWRTVGHFPPRKGYENGPADYRRVTDAIRAAGIIPGMHFFCTKVSRDDAYLAGGHPDPRMNLVCEVFLDRDASSTDTTLHLQSAPRLLRREKDRGLVQFGDELVMYGGFTDTPPYMLTNCVRGLWNSTALAHPRNSVGRHLDVDDWVRFIRCGDSGIVDEIAERITSWINAGGARFFYMDGAEDVPEPFWYHVPRVQFNLWKRVKTDIVWSETALKSHFGWHMHTRGNAFDVFKGELQRPSMRKYILRTARQDADDFSAVDLGWLRLQLPVKPDPKKKAVATQYAQSAFWNGTMGLQPDVVEYVACKAAAWNCPIGFHMDAGDWRRHPRAADCLAAFKRWEDAKLEGRFTSAQREMFKDESAEWMLWPFAPADRPEPVECRQITEDAARPIRAFSYTRGGRSGIVYWNVESPETPEFTLPGIEAMRMRDRGRRFIEADVPVSTLVDAFRKYLRVAAGKCLPAAFAGSGSDAMKACAKLKAAVRVDGVDDKAMGVALDGKTLYCIAGRSLYALDVADPLAPKVIGRLDGMDNRRQIAVADGFAYVVSRETGLRIVDVRDPRKMRLRSRYDSVEFATGLDVVGKTVFLSERINGVEAVDVSDPDNPRHLCIRKTGESQSNRYRDGFLYSGEWGGGHVTVFDAHDMRTFREIGTLELGGFGDGLEIDGRHLYCSTGHDARHHRAAQLLAGHREGTIDDLADPTQNTQELIGAGRGLDIFDLADPAKPRHVSRVNFPVFKPRKDDYWTVRVADGLAFCCDSHNGLFVVDVHDPARPKVIDRFCVPEPGKDWPSGAISSVAVGEGCIYVTSFPGGLWVVPVAGGRPTVRDKGTPPANATVAEAYPTDKGKFQVYRPAAAGQARTACVRGDVVYAAFGDAGLHVLRIKPEGGFEKLGELPGGRRVTDCCLAGDRLVTAEGLDGWAVYALDGPTGFREVSRRPTAPDATVAFWCWPAGAKHAVLSPRNGPYCVVGLDDFTRPDPFCKLNVTCLWDKYLPDALVGDRLAILNPYSGLVWCDFSGPRPKAGTREKCRRQAGTQVNGICAFGDRYLYTVGDRYQFVMPDGAKTELRAFPPVPEFLKTNRPRFTGIPRSDGRLVALTNRSGARYAVYDFADPQDPKLLDAGELSGRPDLAAFWNGHVIIPAGHQGLLLSVRPLRLRRGCIEAAAVANDRLANQR
ncbi:MAG: hypothetical protein IKO72_11035 [Kiritimatiellae bacterium]|nr:hypothetical protein [Kiritimatiellia bacterium]